MGITKSIGKNTLGGGKKMNVDLRTYNRSTHNLSYAWRSSMGVGTLTPFMKMVALPGDTFDIELDTLVFTHPTIGPLFGSYKMQLDIFTCPMRLYMAPLHNNALNVGLDMSKIKIPLLKCAPCPVDTLPRRNTPEWTQINPSSILSYLGKKKWGVTTQNMQTTTNALPLLSYLDIFKNYYANKQEEKFYCIGSTFKKINATFTDAPGYVKGVLGHGAKITINKQDRNLEDDIIVIASVKNRKETFNINNETFFSLENTDTQIIATVTAFGLEAYHYDYTGQGSETAIKEYTLSELDDLREYLLVQGYSQVTIDNNFATCQYLKDMVSTNAAKEFNSVTPMAGLILKTYQSDIFNNWINTEWIDGENGINAITAIDTSSGSFSIDTLNLSKKVYDMLNRIAVSGGTYKDWIDTVYTSGYELHAETPIYEGGMSQEIVFEQVVSNSATNEEPLGTLAGRGVLDENSKKGGKLHIKVKEPSYIMGIASITPRVDYCQGEDWDCELETIDDLHKPALDGIGFQDLNANHFAGWMSQGYGIGKQPAWINYMTNFNKVFGTFAEKYNEQFMVLVKRFEPEWSEWDVIDSTKIKVSSYIEPDLYNYIFADTSISAQNFWVQIGCRIEARRVMSAKQIPNL